MIRPPFRRRVWLRDLGGDFEVSPDGQRSLFMKASEPAVPANLNVVLNWTDHVGRLTRGR